MTIELADDYFDGLPEGNIDKEEFANAYRIQDLADAWSRLLVQAKDQFLAQQEAESKQK